MPTTLLLPPPRFSDLPPSLQDEFKSLSLSFKWTLLFLWSVPRRVLPHLDAFWRTDASSSQKEVELSPAPPPAQRKIDVRLLQLALRLRQPRILTVFWRTLTQNLVKDRALLTSVTHSDAKRRVCTRISTDRKRNMQIRYARSVISGQYHDRIDLRRVLTQRWTPFGSTNGSKDAFLGQTKGRD